MEEVRKSLAERCARSGIPEHMWDGVIQYVVDRIEPGSFLTAILENNFMEAVGRADSINRELLIEWARFVYNEIPSTCHGSPEAVRDWLAARGDEED